MLLNPIIYCSRANNRIATFRAANLTAINKAVSILDGSVRIEFRMEQQIEYLLHLQIFICEDVLMNRKRWLLAVLLVGCGAGVPTMTVTVPTHTFYSSLNGTGLITVNGTEYSLQFPHGLQNQETGQYPYVVEAFVLDDIPSGTYTGTVSVLLGSTDGSPIQMELLGSCTVVVNAVNQTSIPVWFDGTLPLGDPGGGGGPGGPGAP